MICHEVRVDFFLDRIQMEHVSTIIKGSCGVEEQLVHDVALTPCKDETCLRRVLDMCPQKCLDVFFGIVDYLLEFVDGDNTASIISFYTLENFL